MLPLILLVEDEAATAILLEDALAAGGYEVRVAASGEEALAILEEVEAEISGLVTDIRLGEGPNGWELARTARELHAGLPVVYVSGDSAPDHTSQGVPGSVMVQKPFATAQIITAISALLTNAPLPDAN
jgi:DNA-binding response OmpR family regulator